MGERELRKVEQSGPWPCAKGAWDKARQWEGCGLGAVVFWDWVGGEICEQKSRKSQQKRSCRSEGGDRNKEGLRLGPLAQDTRLTQGRALGHFVDGLF